MQLSIVILNYNVKYFLEVCIKSVQNAIVNIDAEIIIVDNASTDGSKEMMAQTFPNIKYLYQNDNLGFPKGNNIGVEQAKGKYLCILNPDTIIEEDTFIKLLNIYKELNNPGIIGTRLIDGTGSFLPESKRGIPTPWVAFTKAFNLYKLFPSSTLFNKYYALNITEDDTQKVDILVGAFMFMKREFYLHLGGFDENCFMYSDDIDLSYLSLLENKNNYYIGGIKTIHFKGESTNRDKLYLKRFRNAMQFFYKKHFKPSLFFSGCMSIGTFLFALKKKNEKVNINPKPSLYILVGSISSYKNKQISNTETLAASSLKETEQLIKKHSDKTIECLINNETISYKDYINFIYKNSKKATFKIKPKNSDYFIGSNDKNAKGDVFKIH